MIIKVLAYEQGDDEPSEEVYDGIDALAASLDLEATPEYAKEVLDNLRAGAVIVVMPNGPGSKDVYEVTP
jgi:hypothetical protein